MLPSPNYLPHVALRNLRHPWFDTPPPPAYSAVEGPDAGFSSRPPQWTLHLGTADSDRHAVVSEVRRWAVMG
jgi:hypothetical protein